MLEDKRLIWRFNRGSRDVLRYIYDKYKHDLLTLATLPEQNTELGPCIEAMETNIEGFGYRIHYKDQAGRKSLDKTALLRAHPDVNLDDFQKIGKPSKPFRPYPIKQRG